MLDAIPVELVVVESPRVVATPAPPAPPKAVTLPRPIVTPVEPRREAPRPEPAPAPPRTTPPTPPAAATPTPTPAATPVPAADASPATARSAPPSPAAAAGSGVSWIDGRSAPDAAPSGPSMASIPRDSGVTRLARPTGGYQVRPSYPSSARRLGIQGTTLLRVHVLADGRVGEVDVETSAGHPDLDQAAGEAVRRWRFEPARRGDDAVAMWVLLPVEFRLK